ncbi:hypothetical protein NBRC116494_09140 [Aurantivibrio plasticivorans]
MDIPGYKIVRTLGKGGMATVFLAIQESFEREVALKVMNASLAEDAKFTARFLSEAKIVSQLVHPNIVTVYDVGVHENFHFLSMQYVPGTDLKQQRKSLSLSRRIHAVKDVAKALDYAGRKGYVHRDVKPENIMLHEEDGHAVLMDFGIATMSDATSGMTQTGTAIGTPHYMSPEQAKGKPVDPRSDIYSLGVVLFLMLTGHVPFDADSAVAVGIKHVSDDIPRLPKNLLLMQPIIDKVLAKEPEARYQTGQELADALSQITEEDLTTIEKLADRAVTVSVDTHDTESPTIVSGSIPTGSSALSGKAKAVSHTSVPKNNPDKTTVAATAVNTHTTAAANVDKAKVLNNHQVANRVSQKTPVGTAAVKRRTRVNGSAEGRHSKTGKTATSASRTQQEEVVSIDAEDRRQYSDEKSSSAKWWLAVILVLVAITAGAVHFQHQLPPPVNQWVAEGVKQSLVWRDEIYIALGLELPAKNSRSISTPSVAETSLASENAAAFSEQATVSPEQTEAAPRPTSPSDGTLSASTDNLLETSAVAPDQQSVAEAGVEPANNALEETVDARSLREELDENLDVAPQLAQLYRDVLSSSPEDKKAEWGLKELREFHYRRIRDALGNRDVADAQRYIDSLEATFDDSADDAKLLTLKEQLEGVTQAEQRVAEGNKLLEANQLTSPKNNNALAKYDEALVLDPNNPNALLGKSNIVDRYREFAQAEMDDENWLAALDYVEKGLAIDAEHTALNRLQQQAADARKEQRELEGLLAKADEQLEQGALIAPRGESAHDVYRQVLSRDADNARAQQGLRSVEMQLSQRIEQAINATEFDTARNTLLAARDLYKNSERLFALEASLETAIQQDFIARQPKISTLLISGEAFTDVVGAQPEVVAVERTLHIGFEFENFVNPTTVLQAVLYDGSRSVQIAQVPVIVSGKSGVKFFTIDRAVEGFSAGAYTIDLTLDQALMSTMMFKVENQVSNE